MEAALRPLHIEEIVQIQGMINRWIAWRRHDSDTITYSSRVFVLISLISNSFLKIVE